MPMYQGDSLVPDCLPRRYQGIGAAEAKTRITGWSRDFFTGGAEDTKEKRKRVPGSNRMKMGMLHTVHNGGRRGCIHIHVHTGQNYIQIS